jgi:hypothetical protein
MNQPAKQVAKPVVEQAKPTHTTVRARATAPGSCNGFRAVDAEFDITVKLDADGKPIAGSWFVIVPAEEAKPLTKPDKAGTLGEGGKSIGADLV